MLRFRNLPIRQKLRQVIVLTSAVALALACVSFMGHAMVTARSQLAREMRGVADVVGINSAAALVFVDPQSAQETLAALSAAPRVQGAWLFDADGRLFATFSRGHAEPSPRDEHLAPGVYHEPGRTVVSRPVVSGNERVGIIVLSAGLGALRNDLRRYGLITGGVLLMSLAVAAVLSAALERVISRPLMHLTETAQHVSSSGDYSSRAPRETDDELGKMVDTFNEMLRQIEARDAALQQANDQLEERVRDRTVELEREVQARARTEHELRASLAEKDVLLKEVHHRVKNNLQVISSLLKLQGDHVKNEQAREALAESLARLRSISLVHEMFYQSEDLAHIDLGRYLRSATSYLAAVHGAEAGAVRVCVDCDSIRVAIGTAVPLGLIVQELTSNALKHAFPEQRCGEVRVALRRNGSSVLLTVADNGVGIPERVRWEQPDSLGLQLVQSLTRQIRGHVELAREHGTCFAVSVPDELFVPGG